MLALGVILIVIGGLVAYFGRPREQLLYVGGVIIFVVGVALVIWWAIDRSGAEVDAFMLPLGGLLVRCQKPVQRLHS